MGGLLMAELKWMKFWPQNYIGDTSHLSLAEHGAYLRLLILAWDTSSCSLPADPAWLKRKLRVNEREYVRSVKPVIDEFWTEEDHRIFQKRQRREWESAIHNSEMGKTAAKVRWNGRKVIPLKTKETG
jgi:uncharacterized protein YdaU (DUF1376 family)